MPLHLPGHNFVGPGTRDLDKPPVDLDDRIAKQHDKDYAAAKDQYDVHISDVHAAKRFGEAFLEEGHPHYLLGALGLAGKAAFESVVGPVYGKQEDGGDTTDVQVEQPPVPFKKPRLQSDTSLDQPSQSGQWEGMVEPQAGGGVPGGTGSSQLPKHIHAPPDQGTSHLKFCKQFILQTDGVQWSKDTAAKQLGGTLNEPWNDPTTATTNAVLLTSLCTIDPDDLPWYMSASEYNQLPPFCYATKCEIKVTPIGFRLPFATNEAASQYANSQTLVQIAHAVGLNYNWNMVSGKATVLAADPTNVDHIGPDGQALEDVLYGGTGTSVDTMGAAIGLPQTYNHYTAIVYPNSTPAAGSPPLMLHDVTVENINDCKGTPCINYEHTFKNGMIKWTEQTVYDAPNEGVNIPFGTMSQGFWQGNSNITTPPDKRGFTFSSALNRSNAITRSYYLNIEKAAWFVRNREQKLSAGAPPTIHMGILPVQGSPTLAATQVTSPSTLLFTVETCLHVTCEIFSHMPGYYYKTASQWSPIFSIRNVTGGYSNFVAERNPWKSYIDGRRITWGGKEPYNTILTNTPTTYATKTDDEHSKLNKARKHAKC